MNLAGFVFEQAQARIIFGAGALDRLPEEVRRLGAQRALVLSTPGHRALAEDAAARLGSLAVAVFPEAVPHVPIETARAARAAAERHRADCCVAIGGGSTIGLAKAIALESARPILAVPTTYAGSEVTPIWGISERGIKTTGRDRRVLPKAVLYDPALTVTIPPGLTAASGMNALAHCVEALYAADANPISSLMAAEGIRALSRALPIIVRQPDDLAARSAALYGAWLAGSVLGTVGMSFHHKLCHTLGGSFNLPHAEVHAVILPHAAAFNRDAAPEAMRTAAEAFGAPDAAHGLYELAARIGAPSALKDIGMPADGLDRAAHLAARDPYRNPRPVEYAAVRQLLEDAYCGRPPR